LVDDPCAAASKLRFNLVVAITSVCLHRSPGQGDLSLNECAIPTLKPLPLNKFPHEFPYNLRGRSMQGIRLGQEIRPQFCFQLHCENGFFSHDRHTIR
jgi:hypothetical protein